MGEQENIYILIIDPFIPTNMNFQTILMPKVNLAIFCQKKAGLKTILKYAIAEKCGLLLSLP